MVAPPSASSRGETYATHLTVPQPFQQYGRAYSSGSLAENHLIPPVSLYGREGSSFLARAPPDDVVNSKSVAKVIPGDSGVVISY